MSKEIKTETGEIALKEIEFKSSKYEKISFKDYETFEAAKIRKRKRLKNFDFDGGARRGGQRRHNQALNRASKSTRMPHRSARKAEQCRKDTMVLPALCRAPTKRRRDHDL